MIPTVVGLDHLVVAVRDLDAAAEAWRALGFTLSPRGLHSAHVGSANYTMMFGEDYLELLAVLVPQPHNQALRDFLARREGLERAAFTTTDAAAGADALRARGIDVQGQHVHRGAFEQVRRFPAGRRAGVQDAGAGRRIKQLGRALRAGVLHRNEPVEETGQGIDRHRLLQHQSSVTNRAC